MLANHIDDRHLRSPRVVQISQSIGQAWAKMKQRARWLARHARITICSSGDDSFKQTEHATHLGHSIERGHYVYFRGAGVCETSVNLSRDQRTNQTLRPVHPFCPLILPYVREYV